MPVALVLMRLPSIASAAIAWSHYAVALVAPISRSCVSVVLSEEAAANVPHAQRGRLLHILNHMYA